MIHFDLFYDSPYFDRWSRFGLAKCVGIVIVITWLPLLILSSIYKAENFILDFTIYARFWIALPLMLISPYKMTLKFRNIVNHFVDSDIVKESEQDKFYYYIKSTMTLRDSTAARTLIWILTYVAVLYLLIQNTSSFASTWRVISKDEVLSSSLAGLWFSFVSQPIYSFVQLYFLYKALLWWRFLFLVSDLDLQLKASHGDDTAGLLFLSGSIRAFYLPVLAFSTSIAAGAINLVIYKGFVIEDLKFTVISLIGFCIFLFIGPLLFFYRPLLRIKQKSIMSYGRLNGHQLEAFEKKWLHQSKHLLGSSIIEAGDFSSVTDTISIVNKVSKMRTLPITRKAFTGFIICIVLPFLPVFALTIPWREIFKQIFALVA